MKERLGNLKPGSIFTALGRKLVVLGDVVGNVFAMECQSPYNIEAYCSRWPGASFGSSWLASIYATNGLALLYSDLGHYTVQRALDVTPRATLTDKVCPQFLLGKLLPLSLREYKHFCSAIPVGGGGFWLATPTPDFTKFWAVDENGKLIQKPTTEKAGVRCAILLDPEAEVDVEPPVSADPARK